MHHLAKVTPSRLTLRKSATMASTLRRAFPAWIDSAEGFSFTSFTAIPVSVTPRVRDSLILRAVESVKPRRSRHPFDVPGGR